MQSLLGPSEALTTVLTEETVHLAGSKKQIALITHDASWGPPSTVEEDLKHKLKKQGYTVFIAKSAPIGNPMLSGAVGLKAADFFDAMEKAAGAGAVISLVGAPLVGPTDSARVASGHPPVLVLATAMAGDKMGVRGDPVQLGGLLDSHVIQIAIIDGGDPAASSGSDKSSRELFAKNYRILRSPK